MANHKGQHGPLQVKGDLQVDDAVTVAGALAVTGASTLTGAITMTGALSVDSTTTSTSGTTGSIHTDGGLGVAGTLFVAGNTTTTGSLTMTVASLGSTTGRALKISSTQATPAMEDGYGVIELELNVTGTATGHITAESSWINLGTSAVVPNYLDVHNDGIYDGTATLTNASISWAKFQCILASNPARMSLWELNFSGAHSEVNALFSVNDRELSLGYQAGTPTAAAVGSVPFVIDSNGTILYIYLYAAADAD